MQQMSGDPTAAQNLLSQLMPAFFNALPVLFVCLIPTTYLTVCWLFTLPLIVDQHMNFGTAMKTSFKMVNKHWWQVFGLTILAGLVSLAGVFACCIGLLLTIPIGIAATLFAYDATLLNLLGTPGLGSLIAGRWLAGTGQLVVFLAGFVLFCLWAFQNIVGYYRMAFGDTPTAADHGAGRVWFGVALCIAAWVWSLVKTASICWYSDCMSEALPEPDPAEA